MPARRADRRRGPTTRTDDPSADAALDATREPPENVRPRPACGGSRWFREVDDGDEVDFVTRDPGEMLGDLLQNRRVFRRVLESLGRPTDAPPHDFAAAATLDETDLAERRARFQERYRAGRRRRAIQLALMVVAIAIALAARHLLAR